MTLVDERTVRGQVDTYAAARAIAASDRARTGIGDHAARRQHARAASVTMPKVCVAEACTTGDQSGRHECATRQVDTCAASRTGLMVHDAAGTACNRAGVGDSAAMRDTYPDTSGAGVAVTQTPTITAPDQAGICNTASTEHLHTGAAVAILRSVALVTA